MRFFIVALFVGMLFLAGCLQLQQPSAPDEEKPQPTEAPKCKTVREEVPYTEEECKEVMVTKQRCEKKEINYSFEMEGPTYICSQNGECSGRPLDECRVCTTAVARCTMRITNLDEEAGAFKVGARFLLIDDVFERAPITKVVKPGKTEEFDFQQFYVARLVRYADCELEILEVPEIEKCVDVSEPAQECKNVTKTKIVEREVCE